MKKYLALVLALMMVLSLAACGGKADNEAAQGDSTSEATEATEATEANDATEATEATEANDATEATEANDVTEDEQVPEDNVGVEFRTAEEWQALYPDNTIVEFFIGEEKGRGDLPCCMSPDMEGQDGTFSAWLDSPLNISGYHRTEDGSIVSYDERFRIVDEWANGELTLSADCVVVAEAIG